MNGERVDDVATHPAFKPLVDVRAHIYDMAKDAAHERMLTYEDDSGEQHAVLQKLPYKKKDWWRRIDAVDIILNDIGGVCDARRR